jgi:hypothetical protein
MCFTTKLLNSSPFSKITYTPGEIHLFVVTTEGRAAVGTGVKDTGLEVGPKVSMPHSVQGSFVRLVLVPSGHVYTNKILFLDTQTHTYILNTVL